MKKASVILLGGIIAAFIIFVFPVSTNLAKADEGDGDWEGAASTESCYENKNKLEVNPNGSCACRYYTCYYKGFLWLSSAQTREGYTCGNGAGQDTSVGNGEPWGDRWSCLTGKVEEF